METTSNEKLQKFKNLGLTLIINFNEVIETVEDSDGEMRTQYKYTTAKVCKTSSRDERIEAIIKTKYPTYGAELAAIHKAGPEHDAYLALRELAKTVATESFS